MNVVEAALLGLIQGLTEFLPVSSSGHLVLSRALIPGMPPPSLAVDVALHLGTTGAVAVIFRRELRPLIAATPTLFRPGRYALEFALDGPFRRLVLLGLGALPVGVVGLAARNEVARLESRPEIVALLIAVTGAWLLAASVVVRRRGGVDVGRAVGVREAFWIGIAQAIAILPGISRSGATLGAALMLGVRRDLAGPFVFLMSVAPIVAAAVLESPDAFDDASVSPVALLAGVAAAFLSGLAALKLLLSFVRRGRLEAFAAYCLLAGPAAWWWLTHGAK